MFQIFLRNVTNINQKIYADVEIPGYFKTRAFLGVVGLGHDTDSLIRFYCNQFERTLNTEAQILIFE